MTQTVRRMSLLAASIVAALAATLLLAASPAQAHTRGETIQYGCGWTSGYTIHAARAITTSGGTIYGYNYLVQRGSYWCSATRKVYFHNTPTWTTATLRVAGTNYTDAGDFREWAAVVRYAPSGCKQAWGYMYSTSGTSGTRAFSGITSCFY
ncbi:MAG TPA: hypothetical protein VFZ32_02925 [Micromonosporaceae bacterium]